LWVLLHLPSSNAGKKAGRRTLLARDLLAQQQGKALLEILIYLHERQPSVIHRDIKPSNVMKYNYHKLHLIEKSDRSLKKTGDPQQ
jgi:serine/threonine protein kinase